MCLAYHMLCIQVCLAYLMLSSQSDGIRRPNWEESRLAMSERVVSSGHPMKGSAFVLEGKVGLGSSIYSAGVIRA